MARRRADDVQRHKHVARRQYGHLKRRRGFDEHQRVQSRLGSHPTGGTGKLNSLPAAITVNGAGADALEINDHGTTGAYNYVVTPTTVTYDKSSSPSPTTFGGVTYSGIQNLELDGTEQPNKFTVTPSLTTAFTIYGFGHGPGATAGNDVLAVSRFGITGTATNKATAEVGHPGSFDGSFTFAPSADGQQDQPIAYFDIETFPIPPLPFPVLAIGSDAGTNSRPIVKVVNALTGDVISAFNAYNSTTPNYTGGVSVVVGYFDGSGQQEIAVAPGKNHSPTIEVFDPFGTLLYRFQAYAEFHGRHFHRRRKC